MSLDINDKTKYKTIIPYKSKIQNICSKYCLKLFKIKHITVDRILVSF